MAAEDERLAAPHQSYAESFVAEELSVEAMLMVAVEPDAPCAAHAAGVQFGSTPAPRRAARVSAHAQGGAEVRQLSLF